MSKAQLVITAVVVEGRSKSEVARDYDVSRQWVQQLCKRYETDGDAAYLPRSRRPHHSPRPPQAREPHPTRRGGGGRAKSQRRRRAAREASSNFSLAAATKTRSSAHREIP
jgi:transposase-like protein